MTKIGGINLTDLKTSLNQKVDSEAADLRSKFITLDSGMDLVYSEKRRESEAYMADTNISEYETPHLTKEAEKFSTTRYDIAMSILTSAYQWANVSALIEELRVWHKSEINNASSPAAARAASVVDWSTITSYL